MSKAKHKGMERNVYAWGVHYRGTREQLVAAGVCNPGAFPGDPSDSRRPDARGVRHGKFTTTDPQGRQIKITRPDGAKRGVFCVSRSGELSELERAELARNERAAEERRAELARKDVERVAADRKARYETAEELKDMHATMVGGFTTVLIDHADEYGWQMVEEDRERIRALKAALVDAIHKARMVREGEEEKPRLRLVK